MNRDLLDTLHQYFEQKENRTSEEELMFNQLTGELPFFQVTSVCRDDLRGRGFDVSKVTDSELNQLASKLSDDYCEQMYWISLDIIAEEGLEIPKHICPKCDKEAMQCDLLTGKYYCSSCKNEWTITESIEPTTQIKCKHNG